MAEHVTAAAVVAVETANMVDQPVEVTATASQNLAEANMVGQPPQPDMRRQKRARRPSAAVTERWERNYQMLIRYKHKYGDCIVSCKPGTEAARLFPGLGKWVSAMRQAYKAEMLRIKQLETGEFQPIRCTMRVSEEQRARLDELGFIWNLPNHRWEQKFKLLQEYKQLHGTCLVPSRLPTGDAERFKGLPYWVTNQRQAKVNEHALSKGWHATTMHRISPDHIEALDAIGFIWNPREKREQEAQKQAENKNENGEITVVAQARPRKAKAPRGAKGVKQVVKKTRPDDE